MKKGRRLSNGFLIFSCLFCFLLVTNDAGLAQDSVRTVHVFVPLCDNENQGIVPVRQELGNGDDPKNNLYWRALYGVKTFFSKSDEWNLISSVEKPEDAVLERCVFKHRTSRAYLVADAYRGVEIKQALIDFLNAAAGQSQKTIVIEDGSERITLHAGGEADLVAYVGHNGLMDFRLAAYPEAGSDTARDVIVLACAGKSFFSEPLRSAGANPLLWTTGLMAPEAYTLKSAIDGWISGETGEQIRMRAARAYHKYQDCGLNAARNLLATGW